MDVVDAQSILDDAFGALFAGQRNLLAWLGQGAAAMVRDGCGIALGARGEGGRGAERCDGHGRLDCLFVRPRLAYVRWSGLERSHGSGHPVPAQLGRGIYAAVHGNRVYAPRRAIEAVERVAESIVAGFV